MCLKLDWIRTSASVRSLHFVGSKYLYILSVDLDHSENGVIIVRSDGHAHISVNQDHELVTKSRALGGLGHAGAALSRYKRGTHTVEPEPRSIGVIAGTLCQAITPRLREGHSNRFFWSENSVNREVIFVLFYFDTLD